MSEKLLAVGWTLVLVSLFGARALAHGGFSLEEERLNVGLVALSFALIAAFFYLVVQGKGGRGSGA